MFEIQEVGQFSKWIKKLRDKKVKVAITNRINMLMLGRFGDHKYLGEKISELRVHIGSGYRIYFSVQEKNLSFYFVVVINHLRKMILKELLKFLKGLLANESKY